MNIATLQYSTFHESYFERAITKIFLLLVTRFQQYDSIAQRLYAQTLPVITHFHKVNLPNE